jgi:NAD(P) transhydrogenase subunit beta
MSEQLIRLSYLLSAVLFILGLRMLSSPKSAKRGNLVASAGMLIAIIVTLLSKEVVSYKLVFIALILGSIIGAVIALTTKMTAMPQMVGLLNGFGGIASALVAISEFLRFNPADGNLMFLITVFLSILIGMVTFSGSVIAAGKLQGIVPGRPIVFPYNQVVNMVLFVIEIIFGILFVLNPQLSLYLYAIIFIAFVLGILTVIPIGGADMPVVICLLNSYSGLAASATGFVIQNLVLIISGALVGASGIILTGIMLRAMNRSVSNVLFGAFGTEGAVLEEAKQRTVKRYTPEDAAIVLESARLVIIVPGYGMAVSQAQHAVRDLANVLEDRGVTVKYAIHPVAGRMPGHMNVLLAEANVPYSQQFTMEEINPEFEYCDVALVIGANDVVNPAARNQKNSPIYGMPILNVDRARAVMVFKRSLNPGFAGIDNELFYLENTMMIFGDAKETLSQVTQELKSLGT